MQNLTIAQTLTMSSIEIAELVSSRHDKVKQSIERLAERGIIQLPPLGIIENINKLGLNQKTKVYEFSGESGKRDSIIVVAQLCPEFTARLVDRWQELEEQLSKPAIDPMVALNDAAFLRGTLLTYTEKVIALEHKVEEMKPDVEAYGRIAKSSDGAVCITDAAKALQVQPKKLFNWMQCNNWIYRRAGGKSWLGYQTKVKQQLLEHKVTLVARSDGSEKMIEQVLITPKGLSKLSNEIITSM